MQGKVHYDGIDLTRCLAALLVTVFHFTWLNPGATWRLPFGWIGVEIFFVISGFVIANSASGAAPFAFLEGRVARLYPAAFGCLPLMLGAMLLGDHVQARLGTALAAGPASLAGSIVLVSYSFVTPAQWTLPVEIAFYGLVFLVLATNKFDAIERIAAVLVLWSTPYVVLMTCSYLGLLDPTPLEFGTSLRNMTLLRHGVFFGLGLLAWLSVTGGLTGAAKAAAAVGLLISCLEIFCRAADFQKLYVAGPATHPLTTGENTAAALAIWVVALAWMVFAIKRPDLFPQARAFRVAARTAGLVTYPLYLLHESVGELVLGKLQAAGAPFGTAIASALVVVLLAAFAIVRWIEPLLRAPLQHLLRKLLTIAIAKMPVLRKLDEPTVQGAVAPAARP